MCGRFELLADGVMDIDSQPGYAYQVILAVMCPYHRR